MGHRRYSGGRVKGTPRTGQACALVALCGALVLDGAAHGVRQQGNGDVLGPQRSKLARGVDQVDWGAREGARSEAVDTTAG